MTLDNNSIFNLSKRGSERAFEQLFNVLWSRLAAFCVGFVGEDYAQDYAINAITQGYYNMGDIDNFFAFKSFCYTTAKNACLNHRRRTSRFKEIVIETIADEAFEDSAIERIFQVEAIANMRDMIKKLPRSESKVLDLEASGLTTDQVSEVLNIDEQTVRNTKVRATEHLRELMTTGKRVLKNRPDNPGYTPKKQKLPLFQLPEDFYEF